MRFFSILVCMLALTAASLAQNSAPKTATPQPNPLSAHDRMIYTHVQGILLRSADKMPEENYSFKPAPDVRTYGQLLGHLADSQYLFCSAALGEKNPAPKVEETKSSKAELVAALKQAFAYCDKAYNSMTDAMAIEPIKVMGSDAPRIGALNINLLHSLEHYGNMVTYMRIKGIVPPTSEPGMPGARPAPKPGEQPK